MLRHDEVHVWRVSLVRSTTDVDSLFHVLASDERDRAGRFHFSRDRVRFIVARGILRMVLSSYLNLEPRQVRFCYGARGKPALAGDLGGSLRFNLSHSHELALLAIAREQELGIDLEYIRRDFPGEEIAKQFFSRNELVSLRRLTPSLRAQRFFEFWVRKEAYIKALGDGLQVPLNQFDVSVASEEPTELLNPGAGLGKASRWFLRDLPVDPGYVAAIALEGKDRRLYWWQS